jgi:hypothetical protein
VRERGGLPAVGEFLGLQSSQALSEPLSQALLCLAAGTLVRMANGKTRPIELVKPGEMVCGANRFGMVLAVRVVARHDNGLRHCRTYRFRTRYRNTPSAHEWTLTATPEHRVLRAESGDQSKKEDGAYEACALGSWAAGDLSAPMSCQSATEWSLGIDQELVDSTDAGMVLTHDLEVAHSDHLYVLANNLIVHNSEKHSGGVASGRSALGGYDRINLTLNPPKESVAFAAHADEDGRVSHIEEAPQGGHHVFIGATPHYVGPEQNLLVRQGADVEAGDVLSDGLPNPSSVVAHKGIGEGRRYLVHALSNTMRDAGLRPHRRNLEVLARGLVDHVNMTDFHEDHAPGDIVRYADLERHWQPREGQLMTL